MEGEERAELWYHPQPFLQRISIRTKQRERAREQHEEGRGRKKWQRDVQQKVEKINKPKLRRKIKNPEFQSYLC